jgi:hypothetical protein
MAALIATSFKYAVRNFLRSATSCSLLQSGSGSIALGVGCAGALPALLLLVMIATPHVMNEFWKRGGFLTGFVSATFPVLP